MRLALYFVPNLVECSSGGGVGEGWGRLLVLPFRVPWWKNLRGPEPLRETMDFIYGSNCSTLAPSLITFSSALPEEISRPKEPAGPTLHHFHFWLLVSWFLKWELPDLITSAPTPALPSGAFSPQQKEVLFSCWLLPRRLCCKGSHSTFTFHVTGKYLWQPTIVHDYFTTSKFHDKKKCS